MIAKYLSIAFFLVGTLDVVQCPRKVCGLVIDCRLAVQWIYASSSRLIQTTYIKFLPIDGYEDPEDQWFVTRDSQFLSPSPMGTFGNVWKHVELLGRGGDATVFWWVEARDAAKHPTVCRPASPRRELSGTGGQQ